MNVYNSVFLKGKIILFLLTILVAGCKKEKGETRPVPETGTVSDVEGNVYKTVKIGNQWWMAENLKVKKYRNGNPVMVITDNAEWKNMVTGACCAYNNNPENQSEYGCLYNWYALTDAGNIAPEGWHIPSDEEWKEMEVNLGMSNSDANLAGWRGSHEGEKLKKESPEGWASYENVWATNETGFTALGGSCRVFNGEMGQPGLKQTGFWWTRTESDANAYYRYLDYKNTTVFRGVCSKNYGFSIRCVKD